MEFVKATRDQVIGGNLHCAVDDFLELGLFIACALAEQFVADVHAFNVSKLGQHAQGGGVSGQLVIGVAEVGFGFIVQRGHAVELLLDLVFDQWIDFIEPGRPLFGAFAQHQIDGALNVIAFLGSPRSRFSANGPGGSNFEAAGPQNHAEVAPDGRILMSELDQLQAAIRHLFGQPGVDAHHGAFEIVA